MTKEKQQLIPALRFPEFENDGEWIVNSLKKVFSIFQGYSFSSKDSVEEGTRWLKIADVSIQKMKHNNPSFLPDDYTNIYDKFLIKKGDYVLALTRPILNGKLKISAVDNLLHNSLLNQRVGKLVSNENLTLVYYLLQTNYLIKEIEKSIAGSEPPNLSMKQIENIVISLPSNPKEQQKIANCLSSLDNLITAETERLDHLKDHKKGLLQQLFPTKGETKPEFRFPEFENDGDWEEKTIDELGNTISGLRGKKGNDFGSGEPYVTYKQVFGSSYVKFEDCGKVKVSKSENQNTLKKGDILFTTSSETPHEVGFASVLVVNPQKSTYLNSFCFALRPNNTKELLPNFSRYLFHSKVYRETVTMISQGSTRFNLSKGAFIQLKLRIPHLKEQQKIANCLSSIDDLIEAQSIKIEGLKDHKKGLMQQLFPNVNELSI